MGTSQQQIPDLAIVQSIHAPAIHAINDLERRIILTEDDTDDMLWQQAAAVVARLDAGMTQRELAMQWINARTSKPYSVAHVNYVRQVIVQFTEQPRPRFRDAYNQIANAKSDNVHFSSETPEHYTPKAIIDLVVACLGAIDLDPCSNAGDPNVPAAHHFDPSDDGLAQAWSGRVYMNPPYGREIDRWVEKLCAEHESANVPEAIALLPARPDTQWFRRLRDHACCFIEGRLTFIGSTDPAPFPSVLFYLGEDLGKFYRCANDLGDVWQRIEPGISFAED